MSTKVFDEQLKKFNQHRSKRKAKHYTPKDAIDLDLGTPMTDKEIEELAYEVMADEQTALAEDKEFRDRGDFDHLSDYDDAWC